MRRHLAVALDRGLPFQGLAGDGVAVVDEIGNDVPGNAVDGHGFFLGDRLGRNVAADIDILRVSARMLHLLFAILLRDDRQALGKARQSVDVIEIAVGKNDVRHRLRGEFRDFGHNRLAGVGRLLGVYDDDTILADYDAGIRANSSFDPVNAAIQGVSHDGRKLLCARRRCEGANHHHQCECDC